MDRLTIEINIINTQLLESLVKLLLDISSAVVVVPELGGDEEIFTLHDRGNKLLESLSDLESR